MNECVPHYESIRSVSVVVPVFNSEGTLQELVAWLKTSLSGYTEDFEVILVNDGSCDSCWQVITDLAGRDKNVKGINLMRNYGQHNALLAGVERATYDAIITIDDDLQHPPEEIPKLLDKLGEGFDVVYGKSINRNHKTWRNLGSRILKASMKMVLGSDIAKTSSSFRAFRSQMRRGFRYFADASLDLDVLLSWSADRIISVPVQHRGRQTGKSGYTLTKLMRLTISIITGYSALPLRIASAAGLLTSLFGAVLFIYVVIQRLTQTSYVPGFAFLAAEIALFAGFQLFTIGIIGEYIARLHFRTMGKPTYVIRDTVGNLKDCETEPAGNEKA
jgi:undecaprenyl-phosphate 4-deoxy-4-formamido-L-arabinose transferase